MSKTLDLFVYVKDKIRDPFWVSVEATEIFDDLKHRIINMNSEVLSVASHQLKLYRVSLPHDRHLRDKVSTHLSNPLDGSRSIMEEFKETSPIGTVSVAALLEDSGEVLLKFLQSFNLNILFLCSFIFNHLTPMVFSLSVALLNLNLLTCTTCASRSYILLGLQS